MTDCRSYTPIIYKGVMVSSTFTDLKEHRAALIKAIDDQEMKAVGMENNPVEPVIDVIGSSLNMVRKASAYIGVISHKYGTIHPDRVRNPDGLSLTELEFNEAQRLNRPILLFIMGEEHDVKLRDIEQDTEKREKLNKFRENAKRLNPNSSVPRIYITFDSLEEFEREAIKAVTKLYHKIDEQQQPNPTPESVASEQTSANPGIPTPPEFYPEPPYIGNHEFVGRQAQLDTLDDWAKAADTHPILLFEAIGGTGKSMLTWHWVTKHARNIRDDWAGIFWYSFYERGAVMADFCRRALAYMTGQPLEELNKKKTPELSKQLLQELNKKPWLFILDGLERVLVSYHRIDAAQMSDEEAGTSDKIARRDPCDAIRPEDDDLLRMLTQAAPSKLLLTTRLTPRCLFNRSNKLIPGVLRKFLPGLLPSDAEELLKSCGVNGTSHKIQSYLKRHCDYHPLVIGVVAGLVNDYPHDPGSFDRWAEDPKHGGYLNLADLDLVQKRNRIFDTAFVALDEKSRQLLSTFALLPESFDYEFISFLNPHLFQKPEPVDRLEHPRKDPDWNEFSEQQQEDALKRYYEDDFLQWQNYNQALKNYKVLTEQELSKTIRDLKRRGLLQYDPQAKR